MIRKFYRKLKLKLIERKTSFHQHLMKEAYDLWSQHNWSYEEFLENIRTKLSQLHYDAVIIGNLNYQVTNGGWFQWYLNDYHTTYKDVEDILNRFVNFSETASELGNRLSVMLSDVMYNIRPYDALDSTMKYGSYDKLEEILSKEFSDYQFDHIDNTVSTILSKYDYNTKVSEDTAKEIANAIKRGLQIRDIGDIIYVLTEGESVAYIIDIVREVVLWECAQKVQNDIRSALSNLDSEYYKFNDDFMTEFNKWLCHRYIS